MAEQAEPATPPAPEAVSTPPAVPEPTPTPTTPEPQNASESPWAQSLQQRFTDPAQRDAVDAYLREEIQPYVTRREQELGEVGDIWQSLQDEERSLPTYLAMAETMYGPEVAQVLSDALTAHIEDTAADPNEGPPAPDMDDDEAMEAWLEQQPAPVQEYLREQFAQREDSNYQAEVAALPGGQEIIAAGALPQFSRYVVATDNGSVEQAKAMWDKEMGPVFEAAKANPGLAQSLGLTFAGHPAPAGEPAPEGAPTVLGATGAVGGPAPPQEPRYATMDDAMDDFFATVAGSPNSSQT